MARQILSGDPRLTGPLAGQGYGGPLAPDFSNAMFSEADPAAIPYWTPTPTPSDTAMDRLRLALPEAAARYRVGQFQLGTPQPGLIHDVGYGYGGPLGGAVADMLPQPPRTGFEAGMMVAMPVASKSVRLYNPPAKRPRSFADDYKVTEGIADEAGKLVRDIEGRPLDPAATVVGRRMVGGEDVPLAPSEYDAVTERSIGARPESRTARELPTGTVGEYRVEAGPIGPERSIGVFKDLSASAAVKVTAHEMGHMVDELAGQIPTDGIKTELRQIYNTLNTGTERARNLMGPERSGYRGKDIDREMMAEAIRAYLADPNYLKTVGEETAKRIRKAVNANPRLSRIIQFNSLVGGAGVLAGQQPQSLNDGR